LWGISFFFLGTFAFGNGEAGTHRGDGAYFGVLQGAKCGDWGVLFFRAWVFSANRTLSRRGRVLWRALGNFIFGFWELGEVTVMRWENLFYELIVWAHVTVMFGYIVGVY